MKNPLSSCTAALAAIVMMLIIAAVIPVYPARGVAVVPVHFGTDCADGSEIVLSIGVDSELILDGKKIHRGNLGTALDKRLSTRFDKVVFVEANPSLPFGSVASVLGRVQSRATAALIPRHPESSYTCLLLPSQAQ